MLSIPAIIIFAPVFRILGVWEAIAIIVGSTILALMILFGLLLLIPSK